MYEMREKDKKSAVTRSVVQNKSLHSRGSGIVDNSHERIMKNEHKHIVQRKLDNEKMNKLLNTANVDEEKLEKVKILYASYLTMLENETPTIDLETINRVLGSLETLLDAVGELEAEDSDEEEETFSNIVPAGMDIKQEVERIKNLKSKFILMRKSLDGISNEKIRQKIFKEHHIYL